MGNEFSGMGFATILFREAYCNYFWNEFELSGNSNGDTPRSNLKVSSLPNCINLNIFPSFCSSSLMPIVFNFLSCSVLWNLFSWIHCWLPTNKCMNQWKSEDKFFTMDGIYIRRTLWGNSISCYCAKTYKYMQVSKCKQFLQ